jgi:four helix bundle protein
MNEEELKKRTKAFAVSIANFCKSLPFDPIVRHYIDQIIRSSASVAANYRAACRARSKPDFINKLRIVEEEADESLFFLELIYEFHPERKQQIRTLYDEGNQLLSIVISSVKTTLQRTADRQSQIKNQKS